MKSIGRKMMIGILFFGFTQAWAADDAYLTSLQKQYQLTPAQVNELKSSGLPDPQLAMVARLSKDSSKSIGDILKMRTEEKMGWGEIAKKLGVPPKEIGQAVADSHRDKKHDHKDKMDDRDSRRDGRESAREDRREDNKSAHDSHGKGH